MGELCIRTVVIAHPDERVFDAARRMRDLHVGCLVIVRENGGREPIGVVTDRDLLFAVTDAEPRYIQTRRLESVMSRELYTAAESEPVHEVLERMRVRGVRRLPVVNSQGCLVGIIAYDDLVEWVAEQLGELTKVVAKEQRRERRARS